MKMKTNWFKSLLNTRLNIRIKRIIVRWKKFKKKFQQQRKPEIDNTQIRAIELFLALLKNKYTTLIHSPESSTRIIESDFVWITMASHTNEYLLTIIDETKSANAHSHEVHIPKEHGFEMADTFDSELEKRFREIENVKKRIIIDDLDKLINKATTQKK